MSDVKQRWLTVEQASAYTGFATGTLYNMVHERKIPHVKKGRALRFDSVRLDEWMERDIIPCVDDFMG